jgi:hypothetical protein
MRLPLVLPVDRWVERWAIASQQHARRNAMVAATALSQLRAENREVEDFLAAQVVRRAVDPPGGVAQPQ